MPSACITNPTEHEEVQKRVHGRHATGILREEYLHDIEDRVSVFCAIVVMLAQLVFESGEPPK